MCKWGTNKKVLLCKKRPYSKRKYALIDSCIANIVQALNNAGIYTIASCCSHGKGLGSIVLKDERELLIAKNFKTARKICKWFFKENKYKGEICKKCGREQRLAWALKNELWNKISDKWRYKVLCLECFLKFCEKKKIELTSEDFAYFEWFKRTSY